MCAHQVEQGKLEAADAALIAGLQSAKVFYLETGEQVTIVATHMDDTVPFYTVAFADGREKQTEASKLQLPASNASLQAEHARVAELAALQRAAVSAYDAREYSKARNLYGVLLRVRADIIGHARINM